MTKNTQAYGRYELRGGISGQSNQALLGLNNKWEVAKGLKLNINYEWSKTEYKEKADVIRQASSLGVEYLAKEHLKASGKIEIISDRSIKDRLQPLLFAACDWKAKDGLTFFTKYKWSQIDNRTDKQIEAKLLETNFACAFRPIKYDRVNLLAKYTWLGDKKPPTSDEHRLRITSVEGVFDLPANFQMVEKFVERTEIIKRANTPKISSKTHLWLKRINYHLTNKWDIGTEYRILNQLTSETRKEGWLFDVNRLINTNFRLGIGYNLTDFDDQGCSLNNYSHKGWFLKIQGKY